MATLLELVKPIDEVNPAELICDPEKGGDAKCDLICQIPSNGATTVQPDSRANETISDQIRFHVNALLEIEGGIPGRKARIIEIMRRRKLIPQARHR